MKATKNKPQEEIDGARVLLWAWSDLVPFGFVGDVEVYGLAICQYENSIEIYRFSCDENWATQQDQIYDSVEQAKEELPDQYQNVPVEWSFF